MKASTLGYGVKQTCIGVHFELIQSASVKLWAQCYDTVTIRIQNTTPKACYLGPWTEWMESDDARDPGSERSSTSENTVNHFDSADSLFDLHSNLPINSSITSSDSEFVQFFFYLHVTSSSWLSKYCNTTTQPFSNTENFLSSTAFSKTFTQTLHHFSLGFTFPYLPLSSALPKKPPEKNS